MSDWLKARYEDAKLAYNALMKFYPFTLEDLDGEEWRPIEGYDGYLVSNFGRVKSFKFGGSRIIKPKLMKEYLCIELSKNGKGKRVRIHRLVAELFIPNPSNKPEVDHVYGMKFDNSAGNLRWVTGAENVRAAFNLGIHVAPQGENCTCAKLTNTQVEYIRNNPDNLKGVQLAEKFGVAQTTISAIRLAKNWKNAGGTIINKSKCRRLTEDERRLIREIYVKDSKEFGSVALGRKYGVSHKTILKIVNEK